MSDQEKQLQEFDPISMSIGIGVALGIVALQLSVLYTMFWSMVKQMKRDNKLSKELNDILKDGKGWNVMIVNDKSPNAFCMIKPYVFITTGLMKMLTHREIIAVLLHEAQHINSKDLWVNLIGQNAVLAIVLGAAGATGGPAGVYLAFMAYFLLGGSGLTTIIFNRTLGRAAEKRADSFAVKFGYGDDMISALEKIEKWVEHAMRKRECGVVCQLVDKINAAIDEHPPIKERIEHVLKKKETYEKTKGKKFLNIRSSFMNAFGLDKLETKKA